jgi:hypothetical protein
VTRYIFGFPSIDKEHFEAITFQDFKCWNQVDPVDSMAMVSMPDISSQVAMA